MLIASAIHATTLKLKPEIDLLMLDGHKISGSWLKGADGIELEKGQHQFLFRASKSLCTNSQNACPTSVPLIATFFAENKSVSIRFSTPETLNNVMKPGKKFYFELIDEHGQVIISQKDTLSPGTDNNVEQAMMIYNLEDRIASVPHFAVTEHSLEHLSQSAEGIAMNYPSDSTVLYRWYMQLDSATRQHLRCLLEAIHTS
ncbi:YccT family protein [Izhakiella capsodis]|nr:DUF2057 family protein [Izhakiella capsodis]